MLRCGTGSVGPGEVCDDKNMVDGDLCSSDCRSRAPKLFCNNQTLTTDVYGGAVTDWCSAFSAGSLDEDGNTMFLR